MPMIDIQRRHAEVFRIRLGDKDGNRPRKLTDSIRITAASQHVVQAFADVYGGEPSQWERQWQVYLPTSELNILVLPGQSVQQWWELYRGSVCERRCDGFQEQKSGRRCLCPEDISERASDKTSCSPMTRVNVLCPDVAVVGAGSLVTHGMIAAETLPQSIAVAESALARGLMVPAILRVVVNDTGRNHFIYPRIEIVGTSLNELGAGSDGPSLPHATDTPVGELEGQAQAPLTPVPADLPTGPQRSIAEQAAPPPPKPKRANAAPEIPRSGRDRRSTAIMPEPDPPGDEPEASSDSGDETITAQQSKALHAKFTSAGLGTDEREQRLRLSSYLIGRKLATSAELSKHEASDLLDALDALGDVRAVLDQLNHDDHAADLADIEAEQTSNQPDEPGLFTDGGEP